MRTKSKESQTIQRTLRIPCELSTDIQECAKIEVRPWSNMAEILLREALHAREVDKKAPKNFKFLDGKDKR